MKVYLVKRQFMSDDNWHSYDELIAVCSTMSKALEYVDKPNFDIIITEYTVDGGPDSETLMHNIEEYRIYGKN